MISCRIREWKMKQPTRITRTVLPWLLPSALLIIWQLGSVSGWISDRVLPAPVHVLTAAWALMKSGELWSNLSISTWRAVVGFTIGAGAGLIMGLITGLSRVGELLLDSTLQMLRNIPHLALIPLVILWFGIDERAKIFLVALGTFFPLYLNTAHGIRHIDKQLIEMSRSYGLGGIALFWQVILPGAMPSILVGVRFSLGLMWLTLIVAETISANAGIGYLAMNAREFLQTDIVVFAILLYALLGKLSDLLTVALEKRLLRWHIQWRKEELPL
nr:aliphatic sulfonate ABC transporter permease SsuC [Rosenbergiella epipactidis]